jgi:hypothetical protein
MARKVKGILFVDYVRMLRAYREQSWTRHVQAADVAFVERQVEAESWYPMEVFERLGIAILRTVAEEDLDLVRRWGHLTAAHVAGTVEGLVVPGDPRESLMRFQVYRRSFFDFESLGMLQIDDASADLWIDYGMSAPAEEAASFQTLGFFEGLVELADGREVKGSFQARSWAGDPRTVARVAWEPPDAGASHREDPETPPRQE